MVALHTRAEAQARAAIDEIHATVGILAMLHAGDVLTDADVASTVKAIEAQLLIIGGALDVAAAAEEERLPVMTLADVVAQARAPARPAHLQLVQGGKA